MDFKKEKWIRQSKAAAILLLAGAMLLAVYGSFAAYTNFNSVKRVVSTGTQSDTMFGSNYLTLMNLSDTSIPVKRISLAESNDTYTFTVQVCNYVWGDPTLYNPKDITYKVTAKLISMDGGNLPDNCTGIEMGGIHFDAYGEWTLDNQSLVTGSAQTQSYSIVIPKDLKDKIKIQIEAVPDIISADAVNNQKLGAILSFADYEATKNWTGHFIDSKEKDKTPEQYDAYNYEISGNGAGTVTVTWPDSLLLSEWVIKDGKQVKKGENNTSSYTFTVDDSTTAVQFQFYKNPAKLYALGKTWDALESSVTVTFTESQAAETSAAN